MSVHLDDPPPVSLRWHCRVGDAYRHAFTGRMDGGHLEALCGYLVRPDDCTEFAADLPDCVHCQRLAGFISRPPELGHCVVILAVIIAAFTIICLVLACVT